MPEPPELLRLFPAEDIAPPASQFDSPASCSSHAHDALVRAARELAVARARFADAVRAARRAGYSWRDIGMIAGLPYQTLHRRFGPRDNEGTMRAGVIQPYAGGGDFEPAGQDRHRSRGVLWQALRQGNPSLVGLVLSMMADGMTSQEILEQYPQLAEDDLRACLAYGSLLAVSRFVDLT
jgi:hypothetical protein